ncbi:MAG: 2-amino-4-hydroxy-6-hydroxymethyldihydropteridine diphosphokinase [Nitrospirae bacterium]|nr:2-amino-4-hydroxy-6-hydroxymethyldihydropteridine diphosphokinase [Nitrospirota bacterium]
MVDVYIGVGSNLGDRLSNCKKAIKELSRNALKILKVSTVYESKPWGVTEQPAFLNLVVYGQTKLTPYELLGRLKGIESTLGREETYRWGPRVIDLDILFYGDQIINGKELIVPHPYLTERIFVLKPLSEIAPELRHPLTGKTVLEYLNDVEKENQDELKPLKEGL